MFFVCYDLLVARGLVGAVVDLKIAHCVASSTLWRATPRAGAARATPRRRNMSDGFGSSSHAV